MYICDLYIYIHIYIFLLFRVPDIVTKYGAQRKSQLASWPLK